MTGTDAPLTNELLRLLPSLLPGLDERQRRLALGAVAEGLGHGGIRAVAQAARVAESTVSRGVRELASRNALPAGQIRRPGAGPKPLTERDPALLPTLLSLVRSAGPAPGDRSPIEWTLLSVRELAEALTRRGHPVGPDTVAALLKAEGFTLQPSAHASLRGSRLHRLTRLRHGAARLREFTEASEPALRVRTEPAAAPGPRRPGVCAECGRDHTAPPVRSASGTENGSPSPTRAGQRSPGQSAARAAVPFDDDGTATLIANALRQWWAQEGSALRTRSGRLLVALEAGPTTTRPEALRRTLADFATASGTEVTVCHLPPATLRWRNTEHRLTSRVVIQRGGLPTTGEQVLISTVGPTSGTTRVRPATTTPVPVGLAQWNYTLRPRTALRS
ncbi:ISAzo13-like element transposase-related protein [Streptomyces cacaoi]|uniref:ISAzo13 family transposase n=1 Tax=Streptomyces cacaoi TaxID=1898 RepID=A0A4Y3QUK0_STRCI|nr:hypothetical protein [Streptomyces cacaoi]NNG84961.1 hypothetical protein [Streptomyces cacaoi]GEB48367.1 hypothetical protein SCA03_09180 [Streptomyces cacaoi]